MSFILHIDEVNICFTKSRKVKKYYKIKLEELLLNKILSSLIFKENLDNIEELKNTNKNFLLDSRIVKEKLVEDNLEEFKNNFVIGIYVPNKNFFHPISLEYKIKEVKNLNNKIIKLNKKLEEDIWDNFCRQGVMNCPSTGGGISVNKGIISEEGGVLEDPYILNKTYGIINYNKICKICNNLYSLIEWDTCNKCYDTIIPIEISKKRKLSLEFKPKKIINFAGHDFYSDEDIFITLELISFNIE